MVCSNRRLRITAATLVALLGGAAASRAQTTAPTHQAPSAKPTGLYVPVDYYTLDNGLRVVLSRDTTSPTVVVAVYYGIGFRIEPKSRTGFAHLFEHLMFQGSQSLGKLQFIKLVESNGGELNGSTRFDFTNYFEVVPSNALQMMLWAEADRMKGLAIDTSNLNNQRDVVKNEVRVNVLNQPYGGFPWIDMPMLANSNWYNAHNFYGDMHDLDSASLADAASFFKTYYAPNNAAMVITGDFDPAQAKAWVKQYFAAIPRVAQPARPDIAEPQQTAEKRATRTDPLAKRPAIGLAYHVPDRFTPEWYAFGLIDQILGQGRDSWFYQELVQRKGLTGEVNSGINIGLGNMYDYNGPMLWIVEAFHDTDKPADLLLAGFQRMIDSLTNHPVDKATLDRARVKVRSHLYDQVEQFAGFGKANILASLALFDNDPARINQLEAGFAKVTPELIQKTAREYLRTSNRSVLTIVPGSGGQAATKTSN